MTQSTWAIAATLPTIDRAVQETVDDLSQGRSVLALLPNGLPLVEVLGWIEREVDHRGLGYDVLGTATGVAAPIDPGQLASMYLGWELGDGGGSYLDAVRDGDFPEVLSVLGIDKLSANERKHWVGRILPSWASQAKTIPNQGVRRALLVVEQASFIFGDVPRPDAMLAVHWWWGFPSEIDVRLLARLDGNVEGLEAGSVEDVWRECLVAALGPGDVRLSVALLADTPQSLDAVTAWLISFAVQMGLDPVDELLISQVPPGQSVWRSPPPHALRELWSRGLLVASQEHGFEIHPAAAAAAGDIEKTIHYRIWRTQIEPVWSIVNLIRLEVCKALERQHGPRWFLNSRFGRVLLSEDDRMRLEQDPRDGEFGYLVTLCREYTDHALLYSWKEVVTLAQQARNKIAHYQPVDRPVLHQLWKAWARITAKGSPTL